MFVALSYSVFTGKHQKTNQYCIKQTNYWTLKASSQYGHTVVNRVRRRVARLNNNYVNLMLINTPKPLFYILGTHQDLHLLSSNIWMNARGLWGNHMAGKQFANNQENCKSAIHWHTFQHPQTLYEFRYVFVEGVICTVYINAYDAY